MRPQLTPELIESLAKTVTRRAFTVWVYLFTRADNETSKTWPSTSTIGKALGINRNHVSAQITELTEAGWLATEHRKGTSNRYRVTAPEGATATSATPHKGATATSAGGVPPRVQVDAEPATATGPHLLPPRDTNSTKNSKGKKKGSKPKPVKFDAAKVGLPFQSELFRKTWGDFVASRETIKAPLTEMAATRILAKCRAWGESVAIEALDTSIESGWKGIFLPKGSRLPAKPSTPTKEPYVFKASD